MAVDYPYFLVNYKIYDGTAGDGGLRLARTVEEVAEETGASFVVAPQTPDLSRIAEKVSLPVFAQSVDASDTGRGNGSVALPTVAEVGGGGVIINHPESRDTLDDIAETVSLCDDHGLESVVCVDSVEMGRAVLAFEPDCLLFEKPGDIETGRSVVRTHPERVESFVEAVEASEPRTRVLVGGGISDAADVERALELGADAAGAASAFVEADDRRAWLYEVADALVGADAGARGV